MSRNCKASWADKAPVGASLLAKSVNDNACSLDKRGALEFFASKLAPTKGASEISNARQHKGEPKLPFNLSLRVLFFYY
ncbi:hypothetical protein B0D71_14720 [Pseudomonas laurylsulfativorans]|uniref:Uncharacterized protein n=1 Tax=Pseudomonas laurylsulfativorans TaxID=1943631 RepID=A0A2S3VNQ3_9PSED|nr:hypothetical protein B0D71_14720 [Pseudomonas laurylsulfativorans]